MGSIGRSVWMQKQPNFNAFAAKMTPAVQRAAATARALEGKVTNTPKAFEPTAIKQALTEADTRAQEIILEALAENYPQVSLEAEEDTPRVKDFQGEGDALVIIDPIDGTLQSYLEGLGPYATIVGLAIERRMHSAIVALPREGLLFRGSSGGCAEVIDDSEGLRPVQASADGDRVFVSHNVPANVRAALAAEGLEVIPACGGAVSVAPLLPGVRAGLRIVPRTSESGLSVRGRVGLTIAREAGAFIRGDRGGIFRDDLDTPHWLLCLTADEGDQGLLQKIMRKET
ncbi:MAG TPA: hypothetical protein EYQ54_01265 [Myxococcales bacterium]|nr:hypothetical protein [Myxococcales bacterium]